MNGEGKAVNLYNIGVSKLIRSAPIRGQCARDYYYGEDLALERMLQQFEGEYARILRSLDAASDGLTDAELYALRDFAFLQ